MGPGEESFGKGVAMGGLCIGPDVDETIAKWHAQCDALR